MCKVIKEIKQAHINDQVRLSEKNLITARGKAIIGAGSFLKNLFMLPAGIPQHILKEAMEKGNKIHKDIQDALAGKAEWQEEHLHIKEWVEREGLTWRANEVCVYDTKLKIGGFIDSIFTKDKNVIIVDWKSNAKLLKDITLKNEAQIRLYNMALSSMISGDLRVKEVIYYTEHKKAVKGTIGEERGAEIANVINFCQEAYKQKLELYGEVYWRGYR